MPAAFHVATAMKAANHRMAKTTSMAANAYGFANFRVRGHSGTVVR